ncbi:Large Sec7 domain containing protein [Cryptosporidium hominis]|uniref:Large Sec7 domain containing protein n=2 Tax=Cryptosporidium hominis TaxID=237895 RepID=A0ABX5B9R5_CRYHO|nr:Large Sec7 domain containing protein [Cryptosporidium hominis]|eukprot:PPS93713.1 Large Sec7 domain containing protein [Cryptosporidium hominis]
MIINTIKSIQKFSSTSRKYKDLEVVASHCIDKLKFFIGYTQLQNEKEFQDLILEFDNNFDLKDYLSGAVTSDLKNLIYYADKKKLKDLSFDEYGKHLDLLYPYILGPIFKACRQYTNPKLTLISLEGINKLLSFEALARTLIEEEKLYGCEGIIENKEPVNGLEFLFTLLFNIYDSKIDDESILTQIIKTSIPLIGKNIDCFSCEMLYSTFLVLFNIYSNTIDNGIRATTYSILIHFVSLFFDDSFDKRNEYSEKYFVLIIEILYTFTMTNSMIHIKKHETQKGKFNQIKLISPLDFELSSKDFIEVENNFFIFSQVRELDPRILRIRNLSLEMLHAIYAKIKLREYRNTNFEDYVRRLYKLHFFSIIKNIVLNDFQARKNSIQLWSNALQIHDLSQTIRLHGIFISKCIRGLFENGIFENSEKNVIIESIFGTLTENISFLTYLFIEFDLDINNENLVLNTINFLINQIMEGGSIKTQNKNLNIDIFTLLTNLIINIKEELKRIHKLNSSSHIEFDLNTVPIRKYLIDEYIKNFNEGNYEKGIDLLSEIEVIDKENCISIARFLAQNRAINKKAIGDYISLPNPRNKEILNHYCNQFSFKNKSLDFSLYLFLSNFHLPGEAQKIDRIIEEFSLRYFLDNPEIFPNKDKIYIIAFSLIMLHTDAHSKEIKDYYRMSKNDFIKNHNDLILSSPKLVDSLEAFYDNITLNEWIFENSKERCKVYFPYIDYLINLIQNLEFTNACLTNNSKNTCYYNSGSSYSSNFQIKIISNEIIHKIANLLSFQSGPEIITNQKDLFKFIYQSIKKKFETIYFNGIYSEDIVYWKFIPNTPIQWIIGLSECLKGRNLPIKSEIQQESIYFQYDGLSFNKNTKVIHSNNILQTSSVIGNNQNLSKWITNNKNSDIKVRDINSIFQITISDLIKEMHPNWSNRKYKRTESMNQKSIEIEESYIILLGKMICCYFTTMLSNVDFWMCFGKETMISWIPILKYSTELGIILGLESSFTINLTVLSYLTNTLTLPLNLNDLFFCNSNITEEIRVILKNDHHSFEDEKYSKSLKFPELEKSGILEQYSDLIIRIFQTSMNFYNSFESKQECKVKDENEKSISHSFAHSTNQESEVLLSYLISNESFSTHSSLNYLNIEAIKAIFEISQDYGDQIPFILWVMIIGIVSQVDRYFYVKTILKGNNTDISDYFDHNKFINNKSKAFGNDLTKFLTLSKISLNLTKSHTLNSRHFNQFFNRKLIKSTKNIFNSTKSIINSGFSNNNSRDNSRSISRASSSRETSPDYSNKDTEIIQSKDENEIISSNTYFQNKIIYGSNSQNFQIYTNLKNSISFNNLWFKDEEIIEQNSTFENNDEMLMINEGKYSLILNQVSLINLRRTEMFNSKLITNELEFYQVMERIFTRIAMDPIKNKRVITNLFLALIFNARNQIVLSGRKSIELFLFRKVFEFMNLILEYNFQEFFELILWDKYFIPIYYSEIIQILSGKAYLEVLDLIKSFTIKFIESQDMFIRSKYLNNIKDENKVNNYQEEIKMIIISSSLDFILEKSSNQLSPNFKYFHSKELNLTQFSIFILFKNLVEKIINYESYNEYIVTVELSLEILKNIQNIYQNLKLLNFLDVNDIIEIYYCFIIGIQKGIEKTEERNINNNHNSKKKKLINILNSNSHSNKEELNKDKEDEILARILLCLTTIPRLSFILDDDIFSKLLDTFFILIKVFIQKNLSKLICKILDYILYMFYIKIKYINNQDIEEIQNLDEDNINGLQLLNIRKTNNIRKNVYNKNQYKLILCYFNEFSQLITKSLILEKKYLDLYYYYLVNISKLINYWLGICPIELIIHEVFLIQNIIPDIINLISLNNKKNIINQTNISLTADYIKTKGVKFLDKLTTEEKNHETSLLLEEESVIKNNRLEDDSGTEEYHDDNDFENDDDDDDEDNCFVNDEADLDIISYISYNSTRNEKSTFEVTNKNSHLDNTQLTLSSKEDLKMKTNYKNNLTIFNKKFKEINRVLTNKTEDKDHLISDEILENLNYDDINNIKVDKEYGDLKAIKIIHNVYKIIEFYIFRTSIKYYRFLLRDWLILTNQILLSQTMSIFCKDDIKIQYKMLIVYINFLYNNKSLFGYKEWHQIFQYYSNFMGEFTKSIQIDPNKYIIEDVRSRYSIDDLGVAYGEREFESQINEKKKSKDDEIVDTRKRRQHNQFEIFFRSKFFNKRYFGLIENKKNHKNDQNGIDPNKIGKYKNKGRRISLKHCLEKNWKCYSHKNIKNTNDQEMYDSFIRLRLSIEELIFKDIKYRSNYDEEKTMITINRPDCVHDLYSALLVIYNILFDWYMIDLRSIERELDMGINKMIYDTIINSLNKLYFELLNGLNLVKFDLFQYNIYLVLWIQLHVRKEFSLQFKDNLQYYKNELLSQCEDILEKYVKIEKSKNNALERREKGLHSDDYYEKKRLSSIISPNIHFNHHFNSSYDRILKNKVDIAYSFKAVLNSLLSDLKEMKQSEYIMKSSRFYKVLLDITLLEDQNLRILSRDILIEFARQEKDTIKSSSLSSPSPSPLPLSPSSLILSLPSEEQILPMISDYSSS